MDGNEINSEKLKENSQVKDLQKNILELSELYFNSIGILQRDAIPLNFGKENTNTDQSRKRIKKDQTIKIKEMANNIIDKHKSIDSILDSFPSNFENSNSCLNDLKILNKEIEKADYKLNNVNKITSELLNDIKNVQVSMTKESLNLSIYSNSLDK